MTKLDQLLNTGASAFVFHVDVCDYEHEGDFHTEFHYQNQIANENGIEIKYHGGNSWRDPEVEDNDGYVGEIMFIVKRDDLPAAMKIFDWTRIEKL